MLQMTLLFTPLLGLSFRASSIQGHSKTPLALLTAIGPTLGDTATSLHTLMAFWVFLPGGVLQRKSRLGTEVPGI